MPRRMESGVSIIAKSIALSKSVTRSWFSHGVRVLPAISWDLFSSSGTCGRNSLEYCGKLCLVSAGEKKGQSWRMFFINFSEIYKYDSLLYIPIFLKLKCHSVVSKSHPLKLQKIMTHWCFHFELSVPFYITLLSHSKIDKRLLFRPRKNVLNSWKLESIPSI